MVLSCKSCQSFEQRPALQDTEWYAYVIWLYGEDDGGFKKTHIYDEQKKQRIFSVHLIDILKNLPHNSLALNVLRPLIVDTEEEVRQNITTWVELIHQANLSPEAEQRLLMVMSQLIEEKFKILNYKELCEMLRLGFSYRPLYLVPQFFEGKPLDILFRPGVSACHFNRFKLGRVLDDLHTYGSSLLFSEIALAVCDKEGISTQFNHLDTTSFSVSGQYASEEKAIDASSPAEANATPAETEAAETMITLKHGYSKDHRPDLKQVVLEMIVSQDGGVPILCQAWDGNASDNTIFKQRSEALLKQFAAGETPRYLIADSKLYTEANAVNLARLPYITRIPDTIKQVSNLIEQAWENENPWLLYEERHYQSHPLTHYAIKQRWLVVYSDSSWKRAVKKVDKACLKEANSLDKALFHLQAQRFDSPDQAVTELQNLFKKSHYYDLKGCQLTIQRSFAQKGRPTTDAQPTAQTWQISATYQLDPQRQKQAYQYQACYVIGSNIPAEQLTDVELMSLILSLRSVGLREHCPIVA